MPTDPRFDGTADRAIKLFWAALHPPPLVVLPSPRQFLRAAWLIVTLGIALVTLSVQSFFGCPFRLRHPADVWRDSQLWFSGESL